MGAPYDIDDKIRLGAPYNIDATVRLGAPHDIGDIVSRDVSSFGISLHSYVNIKFENQFIFSITVYFF
jgi:hypothetical protein